MSNYWIKRAESILLAREKETELYLDKIARIYKSTENQINLEIQKIFNKYSKSGDLLEEEARVLLSNKETKEYYNNLLKQINNVKNKDIKKQLLSKYNAPAYNYRISRLEALKNDIYIKCKTLADKELEYSTKHYTDTIKNTYSDYTQVISQYKTSQAISFAAIDNNVLNKILTTKWLDSNFSQRIWGNTELLANNVNNILQKGLLAGLSNQKMASELKDVMQTSTFNAERLIRTETNHFHNQAELQSYIDNDIMYYKYLAILDKRTSLVCTKLNGKIYSVKDAKTGINYPPMHPFCRSTTIPVFEDELELLDTEQRTLNRYISSDSYKINEKLRNNTTLNSNDKELINNLDSALAKMPNYCGNIVRVLDIRDKSKLEEFVNSLEIGKKKTFNEYLSFSNKKGYNDNSNIEIYINSTQAKDIIKYNKEESELLYNRNSKFNVLDKKYINNKYYIYLEELYE